MPQTAELTYQRNPDGIFQPSLPLTHRDTEYDQRGFDLLWEMQLRHFWYRGRHRFLHHATRQALHAPGTTNQPLNLIDLGGGCGGWLKYLIDRHTLPGHQMALADSSLVALQRAKTLLPPTVSLYQADLLNLGWQNQWNVVYLLDVLEHLPDDEAAMAQVARALKPGGLAFTTMPALQCFWSYNDEAVEHQRRYDRDGLARLARASGLRLVSARYFMFFLSPLLWFTRLGHRHTRLTKEQKYRLVERAHTIPGFPLNQLLAAIFSAETPLGHWLPFPWGTSILGLFQKR